MPAAALAVHAPRAPRAPRTSSVIGTAGAGLLALGCTAACTAHAAVEDAYPARPVRLIVPFPPGGTTDIVARIFAEQMQAAFRQSFLVDNRGGASTNIGMAIAARAAADGYTLLANTVTLVVNPSLYDNLSFDPAKDFTPVVLLSNQANVLTVHASLQVQTLPELIERARAKPGSIKYATGGGGTNAHLAGVLLGSLAKVEMQHVPYRGTGPALAALLGGEVEMMFNSVPAVMPLIRNGRLIPIGVSTAQRTAALPSTPTIGSVVPGFEASSWVAVVAPTGTPAQVVARLNTQANAMLQRREVRERLEALGTEAAGGTPKELAVHLAQEAAKWKRVVQLSGAKGEQ